MQVQNLNTYVDTVRHEILERHRPGEADPYLRILSAAHLEEEEYFSQLVSDDLKSIIHDIRTDHKGDSESAPVNSISEELRQNIEETMNFKGSDAERQAFLYCKQLGINYNNLTKDEFQQFAHILMKSSLLKRHSPNRKKRKH